MDSRELAKSYIERILTCKMKNNSHVDEFTRGTNLTLGYLCHKGNQEVTAGDIAKFAGISTARVAVLLNQLEQKDYLKRIKSSVDKRKTIVVITEGGTSYIEKYFEENIQLMQDVVEKFGEEKMEQFISTFTEIAEFIKERKKDV